MNKEDIKEGLKVKVKNEKFNVTIVKQNGEKVVLCEWYTTTNEYQSKNFNIDDLIYPIPANTFSLKWKR